MGGFFGLGSLIIVELFRFVVIIYIMYVNCVLIYFRWFLDYDYDEEGIVVIVNLYGGGDIYDFCVCEEFCDIKMDVFF